MAHPRADGTYDEYPVTINVEPAAVKKALDDDDWSLALVRDRDGRTLMLYGSSIVGLDATTNEPDDIPLPLP